MTLNKDKQQLIKEIESIKVSEGLGMGGPTPAQAYNFALDKVIEIIKRFNPKK